MRADVSAAPITYPEKCRVGIGDRDASNVRLPPVAPRAVGTGHGYESVPDRHFRDATSLPDSVRGGGRYEDPDST
jgi:hypothetical protein